MSAIERGNNKEQEFLTFNVYVQQDRHVTPEN